ITRDPGIMFREIRLVPYVRGGRTKGFIFEWIKPGSLFYRAGLRKGDILLSINNRTIRSAEDAFRLLQLLRNESSLRIVLLRKGQRREINVRIE
ncbi:MAG TPA: PDZ domain-containing protein, partial [Aquifex aeolicus]|nr:PDZ domain-containing protein [Aquifex aeolicus]